MNDLDKVKNNLYNLTINQEDIRVISTKFKTLDIIYYYVPEITPIKVFNDFYLDKITTENYQNLSSYIPGIFMDLIDTSLEFISYILNKGNMIIIINNYIYFVNIAQIPKRTPQKTELDPTNLLDSLDGLVENVYDNLSLIKKRIKSPNLIIKKYALGSITQNETFLIYLKEYEDKQYIKKINETLINANLEICLNIKDINNLFSKSKLLPNTFNTGSPDFISSSILEGKAVIITDNSPISLILPTTLSLFTSIKNEINSPKYFTLLNRIFIILFFNLSLFLIPFFIAFTNFTPTLFSTLFMANFQLTERGTTFPLFIESLIILFMFEFYRHTTSRAPTNYVQNIVIIFGGLFIGQNAINSGIVGSSILLLTSISYISSFGITNNPYLITSFNIFRIYNIILAYLMGIIGVCIGIITTLLYLSNQKSLGVSFLYPFIPFDKKQVKKFFIPTHGEIYEENKNHY